MRFRQGQRQQGAGRSVALPQPVTGAQQQVGERIAHGCDCLARKAHSGEHGERRGERRIGLRGGRRVARQAQLLGLAIGSEGATTEREQTQCGDRGKTHRGKTHHAILVREVPRHGAPPAGVRAAQGPASHGIHYAKWAKGVQQ